MNKGLNINMAVIGVPGSRKELLGKMIAEEYGLKYICTGDLIKKEVEKKTNIYKLIIDDLNTGNLVNSTVVDKVVLSQVPEKDYVLTGYPRSLVEIDLLTDINIVIYLVIDEYTLAERVLKRTIDDPLYVSLDLSLKRLETHNDKTLPVVEYYRNKGILIEVDDTKPLDDVFREILQKMDRRRR